MHDILFKCLVVVACLCPVDHESNTGTIAANRHNSKTSTHWPQSYQCQAAAQALQREAGITESTSSRHPYLGQCHIGTSQYIQLR